VISISQLSPRIFAETSIASLIGASRQNFGAVQVVLGLVEKYTQKRFAATDASAERPGGNFGAQCRGNRQQRNFRETPMPLTIPMIGIEPDELAWLRLLVSLLRHPDPVVPELARQALLYLQAAASKSACDHKSTSDHKDGSVGVR
jgi:hypothetical protein